MDEYVKQSIDARKNAIFAAYQVGDEGKKKVEKLFGEIEKLGASCKDVGDFEAEFAASPLNQEYLDLFTEIATNSQLANAPSVEKPKIGKMVVSGLAAGAADRVVNEVERKVVPTRAAVHQQAYDAARDIPVVGDAIDVSQKVGYARHLGKIFRKKKEE